VIVVDEQMELVRLVEISDNSYEVSSLYPQLKGPTTFQRHFKQDWALNETTEDRLAVLVHRRT